MDHPAVGRLRSALLGGEHEQVAAHGRLRQAARRSDLALALTLAREHARDAVQALLALVVNGVVVVILSGVRRHQSEGAVDGPEGEPARAGLLVDAELAGVLA